MYPVTLTFPDTDRFTGVLRDCWRYGPDGQVEVTFESQAHGAFIMLLAGATKLVDPPDAEAIRDAAAKYYADQGFGAPKGEPVVLTPAPPAKTEPAKPPPAPVTTPPKQERQMSLL